MADRRTGRELTRNGSETVARSRGSTTSVGCSPARPSTCPPTFLRDAAATLS